MSSLINKVISEELNSYKVEAEGNGDGATAVKEPPKEEPPKEEKPKRRRAERATTGGEAIAGRKRVQKLRGTGQESGVNVNVKIVTGNRRIITIEVIGPTLKLGQVRDLIRADPSAEGLSVSL